MKRFFLTLMFITSSALSQPAQQQAQPPIVVQVQMPPESIWAAIFKLAIPTVLAAAVGAGITFFGVRQTNKHHATKNAAESTTRFGYRTDQR
jgi:hypothetical protein